MLFLTIARHVICGQYFVFLCSLALRMLYMIGNLEEDSPAVKMLNNWDDITDHLELMFDQKYSFVYSNPMAVFSTAEQKLERALTVCLLLKLVQMIPLFPTVSDSILYLFFLNIFFCFESGS